VNRGAAFYSGLLVHDTGARFVRVWTWRGCFVAATAPCGTRWRRLRPATSGSVPQGRHL